jgi:alanine racemase
MRPSHAVIDLGAIHHNISEIRSLISPSTTITAVVKANAYGHGSIPVSRTALAAGAARLAVAIPEEAIELRSSGFRCPLWVLGASLPEQAKLFADFDLIATVSSDNSLKAFNQAGLSRGRQISLMLKVDTGMGRVGVQPAEVLSFVESALSFPGVCLAGLFTHFASADESDPSFTQLQFQKLQTIISELKSKGISLPLISAANSAATLVHPSTRLDAVRPGIILYGLPPDPGMTLPIKLQPAMTLKTQIVHIKKVAADTPVSYGCTHRTASPTWLATLPIGYADGYSRHLSNKAPVLIGGKRRPIVGRVCMDQIVVDLGPECDAQIGDEAVMFGRQGNEEISLTELAVLAGTINYELACAVSQRVPRVYVG